jgi:hypothetical protein
VGRWGGIVGRPARPLGKPAGLDVCQRTEATAGGLHDAALRPVNPAWSDTMIRNARIVGAVAYREGDGPNIPIRPGPCEVELTARDATISWVDDETHGSTAIPLADFQSHVLNGAIEMLDPVAA